MKPEYQSILSAGIEKKYRMLEQEIMSDVVRRIQKAGKITDTADWQLQRYMVLGHSTEDVENIIRSAVGGDYVDTFRLYDEVIETEYVRSKAMYEQVNAHFTPYEQNYELQQLTNALIQQSNDELFNISKSLGFMVDMGNGRKVFTPLSEIYNGYLDNAITMMASGAYDYNTLIRKVVGQMTASGLRTVDYASGHSNRVDVAIRRALLTGMGQLTGRISDMNGQRLGTDQFEIDWHPGARPDHAVWQGRVWRKEQLYSVCGLGTGPGLLGWNCRHTYYPFIPGVSVRNYSDEWLEAKAREEAEKKPFRGKEYNLYEATQKQRQMETAMRAQREKVKLLQEGKADKDDIINAKCKYQAQLDEYAAFSKKFNLPEQRERIYYDLKGRVAPSQHTYKKWQAEQANKAKERAEKKRRADMRAAQKAALQKKAASDIMDKQTAVNNNSELKKMVDILEGKLKVAYNQVAKREKALTEEEIIQALSGGDRTKGSCASVGLAYVGQKNGLDVLDFRGGESQNFFSTGYNLRQIMKFPNSGYLTETARSSITAGNKLLKQVENGKEYYFIAGRHAAIVRRTDEGVLQYLELQSATQSGWTNFNGNPRYTLSTRFGCSQGRGYDVSAEMIDVEILKKSQELPTVLGYINTSVTEQKKGMNGVIK
ncbi:phage minor capsid protein [uncultured Muribaculum sp.]|uniref:phage minor capsid protein n=1 Tax=uncultured Muribaculum sp. TaxID=1918613 RepID=UPI0032202763